MDERQGSTKGQSVRYTECTYLLKVERNQPHILKGRAVPLWYRPYRPNEHAGLMAAIRLPHSYRVLSKGSDLQVQGSIPIAIIIMYKV